MICAQVHGVEQLWETNITEKLPDFSAFLAHDNAEDQPGPDAQVHGLPCILSCVFHEESVQWYETSVP
jgi:hypothetical protein